MTVLNNGADTVTVSDTCTHPDRIGWEVRGVYDGVLWWSCPGCLHAWPAWEDGRRGEIAANYVAAYVRGASDGRAARAEDDGGHDYTLTDAHAAHERRVAAR